MPIVLASNSQPRSSECSPEEGNLSYWRIVWVDFVSITVVAASMLWVYYLPMYFLDHRLVPVSQSIAGSNMAKATPDIRGPLELSFPLIEEPLPSWACGVVVVVIPILVITMFQLKLRSLWDFHAGLTGTLKATISATVIATILKHFIGGFRPHFMDVCQPNVNLVFGQAWFNSTACTASARDVNRAIQGFPSGHTSSAFASSIFLALYLNAKLKAFADHASEFWVFVVTIAPLLLASLVGGSMYLSYQHHAYEIVAGMLIGLVFGTLGYRSAYAAVFDFRYNHIPLPPFGSRTRFRYAVDTLAPSDSGGAICLTEGDTVAEERLVMWSWWTKPGTKAQDRERGLSWLKSMKCVSTIRQEMNMQARLRIQDDKNPEVWTR